MNNSQLTADLESGYIEQIKAGKTDALKNLCNLYRPLINSVKRKYYVRSYDSQDWDQDAMIICYAAVMNFDQAKGKFSSYYKTRLLNHAKSLVRYETAYRRKALSQSVSLESAVECGLRPLCNSCSITSEIPMSESLEELVSNLSQMENIALLIVLGVYQSDEVMKRLKISQLALARARARLFRKMRSVLSK